jgi:midasin
LAVLTGQAIKFKEPVLLVGETGCGKTTVVQYLAKVMGSQDSDLQSVNCHMHSESSDFLGGLRPVRATDKADQALFEWVEGPLVIAMKTGHYFLADEISLADDSVLERLNSVLGKSIRPFLPPSFGTLLIISYIHFSEPERRLFVAERADQSKDDLSITAHPEFRIFGTMNPGRDYGKKELSPALRNRFTEIWAEQTHNTDDIIDIIEKNLKLNQVSLDLQDIKTRKGSGVGQAAIKFIEFFKTFSVTNRSVVSTRDILAWVEFINKYCSDNCTEESLKLAFVHGASMVFLDALGSGVTAAMQ